MNVIVYNNLEDTNIQNEIISKEINALIVKKIV